MNKRSIRPVVWTLLGAALCAAGTACKVGPNYQRPPLAVPTTYKSAATPAAPATPPAASQPAATQPAVTHLATNWWLLFGDPELSALEETTIKENQDIKAAMARVDEARALAGLTKSQFYPQITLNPSVQRSRSRGGTVTNTAVPLQLSYEVDIWGQVRRAYEASKAQLQFSVDDFQVVLQAAQAEVAQDYFTIRSLDAQDAILGRNVDTFRKQVALTQTQFKTGLVSQLDVVQAQAQLNATISQEVDVRRQRADLEHAVAILLGRPPAEFALPVKPLELAPPVIPVGLPSDLLRQRPDVAQAEENLIAANAQIGVATSQFYPAVHLTGAAGFESIDLQHALDWQNRMWSFGPSVSFPVFLGGQLESNLAQAKARYNELLANYRTAVLGAFRDVEDSLTDLHLRADEAQAQELAVQASRDYVRLSQVQYQRGLVNYLTVIDADRTLLANELSAAQILNQRLNATVLLIKALGGGWDARAAGAAPATTAPAGSR